MNQLHPIAQAVQSQGRGNDTQLIHMTPSEVQGLQALAMAHGGSLTINPSTGLPEAGFLESILPTVAGFALNAMVPGLGTLGSAALVGLGTTALNGGDLGKGLMAGLGAYGGAGLSQSLIGAGAGAAQNAAIANVQPQVDAATKAAQIGQMQAPALGYKTALDITPSAVAQTVAPQGIANQAAATATQDYLKQGAFSQLKGGFGAVMDQPGQFLKDNWKYAAAAAAPVAMDMMGQKDSIAPKDNEQFQYDYSPNRASEEDLAAQLAANPYGELTYFRPKYGPRQVVQVAQGGELKYADGGIADEYEYDPVTRTYKKKASAPTGAVAPVGITGSDSGGDNVNPNDNYYSRREAQLRAANMPEDKVQETLRSEQVANNEKLGGLLGLLAPGSIARALVGGLNTVTGGATGQTRAPVTNRNTSTPDAVSESQGQSVTADPTGATETYGDTSMGTLFAQGGALRYEDGGPIGAVEPVGLRGNRPMDANYARDVVGNIAKGYAIEKGLGMLGVSPQLAALGMAGKGIYNFFNPDRPAAPVVSGSDFPSVPGQNPSGDSGGNGGYTVGDGTQGSASMSDYGGEADLAQGGLAGLSAGGMAKGGFVVPADVVSALGNGSTDAGLRTLQAKLGNVKPIKGKGDGLSDSIPTSIDGKQPARVADGEAYIPPEVVAKIGGGNSKKGAKKLYAMMDKVRQQAHGKTSQQRKVNAKAVV